MALVGSKIGLHDLDASLISFFEEMSESNSKLVQYTDMQTAEIDGQTEFTIDIETIDSVNDSIMVQSGRTLLFPGNDFVVEGNKLILAQGVSLGRTIGIYVWKNVQKSDVELEDTINGSVLANGSVPLNKLEESLQKKIASVGKLQHFFFNIVAEEDGQTEFTIPMATFNDKNDFLLVIDGRGVLVKDVGYTVNGRTLTVTTPWNKDEGGAIIVLKNAPVTEFEEAIDGTQIADGSIPLVKLEEMPEVTVTSDVPIHLTINENGGLSITYDDGSEE